MKTTTQLALLVLTAILSSPAFAQDKSATAAPPAPTTATASPAGPTVDEKLEKLSERILELEAQNQLNKVRISGVFISRYEHLINLHGLPGADKTREDLSPLSMHYGLDMAFDATKNLKFYSTLGMSKFFNNEGRNESLSAGYYATYQATETGSYGFSGSQVIVDRAYASYEFDDTPLTLAVGRMPTNYGPPANQIDGLPRQGTYPRFSFNSIFDGLAAVYDFSSKLPVDHTLKLRTFYQPFTNIDQADRTKQAVDGQQLPSRTDQYVVMMDYSKQNLSFAERLDLIVMHAWWKEFYDGYSGAQAPLGSPPAGESENGSDNSYYLGFENIGDVGLNMSWSALNYKASIIGSGVDKDSWGHLLNINYKIAALDNLTIGYEHISTQKYFYLDEWTRMNLIPFYYLQSATGNHIYFNKLLTKKIIGTIGYYYLEAGAGDIYQPEESNAQSWYAQIRFDF